MRKVVLYIAASIDGFIAGPKGEIDWLHSIENPDNDDFGYPKFYRSIDTTIMGNSTYKQILSFGIDFPYSDKTNYVFTKNKTLIDMDNINFVNADHKNFVSSLKSANGKNIWLIGGGKVNSFFLKNNFIDEIILATIPIILGKGIPIFSQMKKSKEMIISRMQKYNCGVVQQRLSLKYPN
ncbi:MAG: dihydrofolate reductase [Ignavibacteriae bacterium]|nr:dihydrofolate reductase [Ignavibacteriota bacterium]NOH00098.1 dihydrofolate reductase [Ignavibacteriota bacterium]